MSISFIQNIKSDICYLQAAKAQNFKNISIEKIEKINKNKIEYKKQLSTPEERELYSTLKAQLSQACKHKLPFRVLEILKKCAKQNQRPPSALSDTLRTSKITLPEEFPGKQEKKEALKALKQALLAMSLPQEESLKIVESIHWAHGTNSAILPMLPHNNYVMASTGELLDKGIAPMCGELSKSGMAPDGVSQSWISVVTVRHLPRSWDYAAKISNSFNPSKFEDAERFFKETLESLRGTSPDDSLWDTCVISLLQLKQWDPQAFEILVNKYQQTIDQLLHLAVKKEFYREGQILEALQYPKEELKKAIPNEQSGDSLEAKMPGLKHGTSWKWYEEMGADLLVDSISDVKYHDYGFVRCKNWQFLLRDIIDLRRSSDERIQKMDEYLQKHSQELFGKELNSTGLLQLIKEKIEKRIQSKQYSSAKRISRLKNALSKDIPIKILREEKSMITSPFPILIASTKTKCFFLDKTSEANIPSAKWGDDVDVIFVKPENMPAVTSWLEKQGLADKVRVHSVFLLTTLFDFPLYHTPSDVIGENHVLSSPDYKFIHKHIQSLLPLYQKKGYEHHGVAHATRAAFFSAVITEMYLAQGYVLTAQPKHLPITGFVHDEGREQDFGEDLWDKESGQICADFMANEMQLNPAEVELLSKSIAEKDAEPALSLEQKIIHDADCIEIIRCLLSHPEGFERERLWMFKDQFLKPLLDLFIHEAQSLIALTEKPPIKEFLQSSPDPFRCLLQIIHFTSNFPFLEITAKNAIGAFCSPSDYLLNREIEQATAN